MQRYLGMISGTSHDGVDTVIAAIGESELDIVHARTADFPAELRERIAALILDSTTTLKDLGRLDTALGRFFAECALESIEAAGLEPDDIAAIGHHGQTVFHDPEGPEAFTLQIGDPNIVAARTGVTTVADFRRLDMAYGGQGAPLVPAFHDWRFRSDTESRAIVNIGGIANVTLLVPQSPTSGFDTGPGNALLDAWFAECRGGAFDEAGAWGSTGTVNEALLEACLSEPYFSVQPPKSTGRELFHIRWLDERLQGLATRPDDRDVQATLAELTAKTIVAAVESAASRCDRLIVCGGGAHNDDILRRLERLSTGRVETTASLGIAPDWVEAAAFAWLARARLECRPGNMPSVTGARRSAVLGGVYCPLSTNKNRRSTLDDSQ